MRWREGGREGYGTASNGVNEPEAQVYAMWDHEAEKKEKGDIVEAS